MIVDKEYYHLEERNAAEVTRGWKVFHVILFVAICISGYMTAYSFGIILSYFDYQCILYAEIEFLNPNITGHQVTAQYTDPPIILTTNRELESNETSTNDTQTEISQPSELFENATTITTTTSKPPIATSTEMLNIDIRSTLWGRLYLCNFCQFSPVMSMIISIFLGAFVFLSARGGRGYASDVFQETSTFIFPLLFVTGGMFIISSISTSELTQGLRHFCREFIENTSSTRCLDVIADQNTDLRKKFTIYYYWSIASAHIETICWGVQLGLLVLRVLCVVDYQLLSVSLKEKIYRTSSEGSSRKNSQKEKLNEDVDSVCTTAI